MINNSKTQNKNSDNFELFKYDDQYVLDIFNNVFEIKNETIIHVGSLVNNKIIKL